MSKRVTTHADVAKVIHSYRIETMMLLIYHDSNGEEYCFTLSHKQTPAQQHRLIESNIALAEQYAEEFRELSGKSKRK